MKIKETVIPWRQLSTPPLDNTDFISIGADGVIASNQIKGDTIAYAYRSDLKHYPNDPRDVSKETV